MKTRGRRQFVQLLVVAAFVVNAMTIVTAHAAEPQAAALSALNVAKHHYKKGNFKKAASLFKEAYEIDPNPLFLYNAGRALQRAFMLDQAEVTLQRFLKLQAEGKYKGPDHAAARKRAAMHLEEIRATKVQIDSAKEKGKQGSSGPSKVIGWTLGGLGVAAIAFGAWRLTDVAGDSEVLNDHANEERFDGKPAGLDAATYKEQRDALASEQMEAYAVIAGGVTAAGIGAYLLLSASSADTVTWTPHLNGRGGTFAWRF
jgi:tetratricopeptide (TPR) repeat protein